MGAAKEKVDKGKGLVTYQNPFDEDIGLVEGLATVEDFLQGGPTRQATRRSPRSSKKAVPRSLYSVS